MPPRQYLIIPQDAGAENVRAAFETYISEHDIASVLVEGNDKEHLRETIAAIKKTAHDNDIAILIKDQFDLVTELHIDGVHVTGEADQLKTARETLGQDYIVGAEANLSRHEAMLMGELGADYIAFSGGTDEDITEMCAWWTPLFQIPCVAFYQDTPERINDNNIIDFYRRSLCV